MSLFLCNGLCLFRTGRDLPRDSQEHGKRRDARAGGESIVKQFLSLFYALVELLFGADAGIHQFLHESLHDGWRDGRMTTRNGKRMVPVIILDAVDMFGALLYSDVRFMVCQPDQEPNHLVLFHATVFPYTINSP